MKLECHTGDHTWREDGWFHDFTDEVLIEAWERQRTRPLRGMFAQWLFVGRFCPNIKEVRALAIYIGGHR